MTRKLAAATALATLLALPGAAFANEATKNATPAASTGTSASANTASPRLDTTIAAMTAEQLIGKDIYDTRGDRVGAIEDIVINRQGRVVHALADVGGFLGMGGRRVALSLSDLRQQDDRLVLQNASKATIGALPEYRESDEWTRAERRNRLSDSMAAAGDSTRDTVTAIGRPVSNAAGDTTAAGRQTAAGTQTTARLDASLSGMTAKELIGKDIYDSTGRQVGEIEDIVIRQDGRSVSALADVGGFLGMNEKRVALDLTDVKVTGDRLTLQSMTEAQIKALPAFNKDEWRPYGRGERLSSN